MQEVGQRVLSLVVAWPVWTGFLLLVSVLLYQLEQQTLFQWRCTFHFSLWHA